MFARTTWTLIHRRHFRGWRSSLARLRQIRRLDEEALAAWQARALDRHVAWAARTLPYFRGLVGAGAKLQDLPVLTRREVQANEEALVDPTRSRDLLRRETSGGSTGEPVAVWHDAGFLAWDVATEVDLVRTWGLEPWTRSAFVWGSDEDLADRPWRVRLYEALIGRVVVNAFRMGEAELQAARATLERHRPVYLQGYASALELLARWLLENAPDHSIRPRAIRSSAEALRPEARRVVEQAFGARVYDFYGSRELSSVAAECPAGALHVAAHARVVEVVDDADRACPPGEPGRLVVTDLRNHAFGVLRYDTGDVASLAVPTPCGCGRAGPRLERIHGRTSDFITTPDGERIHGEWFTHLFYGRPGVTRFHVHQPDREHLEVRTVGPARATDLDDLLGRIRARMGRGVDVRWTSVDVIEKGPSGKRRFTTSDVAYLPEAS